jgi:hypothetical protein
MASISFSMYKHLPSSLIGELQENQNEKEKNEYLSANKSGDVNLRGDTGGSKTNHNSSPPISD